MGRLTQEIHVTFGGVLYLLVKYVQRCGSRLAVGGGAYMRRGDQRRHPEKHLMKSPKVYVRVYLNVEWVAAACERRDGRGR